ncbi:acetyltransferase [Leifsonia xyli subsp. xyli str. CTCB07]|uniref:Acetyltransferase n=1 Tax=Leifsonia xyli subsp. xyli (strain CTCB07) TaxID=281090 RepID=Q6AH94_LEIXX|nr:acetyltransferase [Leifsonia xyli subsp. xyli str. CTCB07]
MQAPTSSRAGDRTPAPAQGVLRRDRTSPSNLRGAKLEFLHLSALDGARGLAIISVVLYQSGWSERGLFGVDAFFVISGFLITLLLIREAVNRGRISIRGFYARRARRLLTPVVFTLTAVLLLVWTYGTVSELKQAGETAVFSLLQVANWHQIGNDNAYWEASGAIIPLGQMWSLSATGQFYLVWPLLFALLWFVARKSITKFGLYIGVVFVAASLVAPLLYDGTNTDRLYLGTDARAVAFIAGAVCACFVAGALRYAPRWAGPEAGGLAKFVITALSVVSLTATVTASVMVSSYHEPWLYQGGFAIVALIVDVFVSTLCFPANGLRSFFSWKPFQRIGVISYAIFLVHMPVLWMLKTFNPELPPLPLFGIGLVVSWAVAWVLHYLWAEPLRTARWNLKRGLVASTIGAATVVALTVSLPTVSLPRVDHAAARAGANSSTASIFPVDGNIALPVKSDGTPVTVAVIGDSVAGNMYESLADYYDGSQGSLSAVNVTTGGCGIFDADSARSGEGFVMDTVKLCWPWQEKLQDANAEQSPDVYILHNLWDANDQLIAGEWVDPGDPAWADRYRAQLERLVEIGHESGNEPLILLSNDRHRDPGGSLSPTRLGAVDAVADEIIAEHPNVKRLDFRGGVCPDGTCAYTFSNGEPVYRDGAHFASQGLTAMAPWLVEQIARGLTEG